ncbi:MAG: hypothetical protein M5U25_12995 [Planctomycetota bacterium]|nr:hypothetical protein [Planctomycetota bacterium]
MDMRPFGPDAFDNEEAQDFLQDHAERLFTVIRDFVASPSFTNGGCYRALAALAMINALNSRRELETLPDPKEVEQWRSVFEETIRDELDWLPDDEKARVQAAVDQEITTLLHAIRAWRAR